MSELIDYLKRIAKDKESRPQRVLFSSPRMFGELTRRSQINDEIFGTLHGMPVYISNDVPDDEVHFIDVPEIKYDLKFAPIRPEFEKFIAINSMIRNKIMEAFGLPAHLFHHDYEQPKPVKHPKLEIPPERWKFQKATWITVLSVPVRVVRYVVKRL